MLSAVPSCSGYSAVHKIPETAPVPIFLDTFRRRYLRIGTRSFIVIFQTHQIGINRPKLRHAVRNILLIRQGYHQIIRTVAVFIERFCCHFQIRSTDFSKIVERFQWNRAKFDGSFFFQLYMVIDFSCPASENEYLSGEPQ